MGARAWRVIRGAPAQDRHRGRPSAAGRPRGSGVRGAADPGLPRAPGRAGVCRFAGPQARHTSGEAGGRVRPGRPRVVSVHSADDGDSGAGGQGRRGRAGHATPTRRQRPLADSRRRAHRGRGCRLSDRRGAGDRCACLWHGEHPAGRRGGGPRQHLRDAGQERGVRRRRRRWNRGSHRGRRRGRCQGSAGLCRGRSGCAARARSVGVGRPHHGLEPAR